jgi:hypothetical protein
MTSSVSVIFDSRLYFLPFSAMFQSYNLVLLDHGSNNQLFLTLRKQITNIQKTDKQIHDMTSAINEIDMEFEEIMNVNIEAIGSLYIPFYEMADDSKVVICCQK